MKKSNMIKNILSVNVVAILFTCLLSLVTSNAAAQHYGYTKERPLIIAADWDFQPFEFMNTDGKPSGYNIEVLDLILTHMKIPHKFVMQEWHTVNDMFANRQADLIHALSVNFKGRPYVTTKKYINYYTLRAVRRLDSPPLNSMRHLQAGDTLMLKEDDYAALTLKAMGEQPFALELTTPKTALSLIRGGKRPYFIWGELPLKSKIQELHIDSVALDEIDLPPGELRIIGYDHNIINLIDEEFTRLEQAGDIQPIYDRWFHPEIEHDNASPWAPYVLATVIMVCLVTFLFSRIITIRVRNAVRQSADLNSMMLQALSMGAYSVLEYDLKTRRVHNRHAFLLPKSGITIDELIDRMPPEQRDEFRQKIEEMERGETDHWQMVRRWNAGTAEKPDWHTFDGSALLERENGVPRYIIHTVKDITREVKEDSHNQDLGTKYKLLFDTNIMAMSFYDKDGKLIDINQKMRDICHITPETEPYFKETNLFDMPYVKNVYDPTIREPFHACQHLVMPNVNLNIYMEEKTVPLVDENDEIIFYIVTARDVTAERQMYLQEQEHEKKLQHANEVIRRYDQQMSYLLEESKMFVWRYDPNTDMVHFSHKPHMAEYAETLNEFTNGVPEKSRAAALIQLREFIAKQQPFSVIHQYNYTPMQSEPCWYSISGMPTFDDNGQLTEFFGIARDITQLMSTQQQLMQETKRAEDSGKLKSAFLANMTHEIRTPLNAIVGFSDLLPMVDDNGERMEFIRIIRNNCDMLLRLINDILEASNMGQSLAIEAQKIDLAQVFDDICLSLQQRVQNPDVEFQKDNPYPTFPAVLDPGRLQQLLTNFVTNAVKYTQKGHIRVGYRAEAGKSATGSSIDGIYFYCEDTGTGIPPEQQASVFERFVKLNDFVQGTGLGLSICRAIINKCGGRIGVNSEGEGHGSTFWFWIPREIHGSTPVNRGDGLAPWGNYRYK